MTPPRRRPGPAGNPALRAEVTYSGAGTYTAFILDSESRELERFQGSLDELQAWLRQHYPGVPVRTLPRRNPPARIEWTHGGGGEYLAVVLDEEGRIIEERWGAKAEVLAWMARRWPELPVEFVPMVKEENPALTAWRKETVSDRALRYRAKACPPPGDPVCVLCGARRNVEVGHVNGREEDTSPRNLIWTCRACNVRCANTLRRAGLGRLTRQYNPASRGAETLAQWLTAVMSMKGESDAMPVPAAVSMIRATDPEQRSRFARQIWAQRRKRYGPTGRPAATPF